MFPGLQASCRPLLWPNRRMVLRLSQSLSVKAQALNRPPRSTAMEETFEEACKSRDIPGAVLLAADKTGKLNYRKSFGVRSLQDGSSFEPLSLDATMWIASCTKLLTSIAAMQCVERGLITLDEDVRSVLPELNDLDILLDVKDDGTILSRKNTVAITLRQLLTHTSGFSYEFNEPLLKKWRSLQPESQRRPPTSVHNRFLHPLLYEPGTSWSYGPSIDWAGVLIERITHSKTLEDYMRQHIWEPLGITDMTFFLSTRPDLRARTAAMSLRNPITTSDDPTAPSTSIHNPDQITLRPDMDDAQGGGGIYTSATEFMKVLLALLRATDAPSTSDVQLLHQSTAQAMFAPQLGPASRARLQAISNIPRFNYMLGGMPVGTRKDWALGGLLVLDNLPGWRRKGTMSWGGTPNLTWWIDCDAGLCGLYASQIMPIGDAKSVELCKMFEKTMYERLAAVTSGDGEGGLN